MECHVPIAFAAVTQCFDTNVLEDGKVLVGLCTTSGQVLELVDKKVVDSCDIGKDADDIKIFTSYNPLQKYFLVSCKKQLIVIKRSKPLCIFKTYNDVKQVQIKDRLCLGRPQVVIWTLRSEEPIVTDFMSQLYAAGLQTVPHLTASLSSKLQEMNLRLVKARKLLQEKREVHIKALYQETPHLQPLVCETQNEPKVLAWGPPLPAPAVVPQPPLQLSRPWRRVHNGKWIVGVPVFNSSNMTVDDIKLRLQMDCCLELKYDSKVIVFPQRVSTGAEWMELPKHEKLFQIQPFVPAHTSAVVVGVMEEPPLKLSSVASISGAVLYKHSETAAGASVQDLLGSVVQFKVEDLVQGNLIPFSSVLTTPDERDLVSLVVTSSYYQLCVSSPYRMSAKLTLSDHGLQPVSSLHCWVGQPQGSLAGLLVFHQQISSFKHLLQVYAKDTKQVLQFVHSLCSQWRVEECRDSAVTVSSCVKSLAAELQLLLTVAQAGSEFTSDKWTELRNRLNQTELVTDLNFLSFSPH